MRYRLLSFLTAAVIAAGISACGSEGKSFDPLETDRLAFGDSSGDAVLELDPNGAVQLTAKVKDAAGRDVAERVVTFALVANASGATLTSARVSTNTAGEATILYRAGAVPGFDVVRASISNGAVMEVSITVGGGATGTQISLSAAPTSLAAGQSSILTATVTNGAGNPVKGQTVTFAFSFNGNNSGAAIATVNGTTDVSGRAVAVYTAGTAAPTAALEDTVQASVTGSADALAITRTAAGGGGGVTLSLAASVTSLAAGESAVLTATLTDGASAPVSGQAVTFAFSTNNSGAALVTLSGTTDVSGRATAQYTAGANSPLTSVQDTVLASVAGSADALAITRTVGGAAGFQIGVTATPTALRAGEISIVIAQVTNADGTVARGQTVTFAFVTNGNKSGATLAPLNGGTTDAGGMALAVYTAGSLTPALALQDAVSAAVPGSAAATIITRQAASGAGTRISSLAAAPSTLLSRTGNSIVTATVVGSDNAPAPGVSVTFSIETGGGTFVTDGGPSPAPIAVTTGNDGKANAVFTGPGIATSGEAVIRAQLLATPGGGDAVVIIRWN